MPIFNIRFRVSNPFRALRQLSKFGTILGYEMEPGSEPDAGDAEPAEIGDPRGRGRPPGTSPENADRDAEIVALYQSDPKVNNSQNLANRYGISRERVCQVLRRKNIIEHVRERRNAAREAMQDETAAIRDATKAEVNARIERAIDAVKSGMSIRKALIAEGFGNHTHIATVVSRMAQQRGIKIENGRHRDFSKRRKRVMELFNEGLSIPKIVEKMRNEDDPKINEAWVYRCMPDVRVRQECSK